MLERYGKQEGSLKGHNPRKHGGPAIIPLLAVLKRSTFPPPRLAPEAANCGTSRGVVEFLKKLSAVGPARKDPRLLRADSGFFTTSYGFGTAPVALYLVAKLTP